MPWSMTAPGLCNHGATRSIVGHDPSVSAEDQNPAMWHAVPRKAGCGTLFKDEVSPATLSRFAA